MRTEDRYFQTLTEGELWQRYCGFLELSVGEFMAIQESLLLEEIDLVADSLLGKKIMGGNKPRSVDEFRRVVPLTTYEDYEPYLSERQEDALAVKPYFWTHSSGRGGHFKWIPYARHATEVVAKRGIALFVLASAHSKGRVAFRPGARALLLFPPQPYVSGSLLYYISKDISVRAIPPFDGTEDMEFQERIKKGFGLSLRSGVDVICAVASVLVKVGESMADQAQRMQFSFGLLRPPVAFRLVRAWIKSRIARRAMLPKDLWRASAILSGGTDAGIYRDQIAHYWGQLPYESYSCAEAAPLAMQAWNKKWMTFIPDIAFLEFIPYESRGKSKGEKDTLPSTVLLSEVKPGKTYEVVITQLYGMPLLRYRMRDLVTFVAAGDEETGIQLPQMVFKSRIDDIIALAGLAELDERIVWQAMEDSGLKYADWSACKEYDTDRSYLRLYLELKEHREASEIERLVDLQLKTIDIDYRDIDTMLGLQPVRVTLLSPGTFQRYYEEKQKEGADLAHLKPPHMNASDAIVHRLLELNEKGSVI